MAAQGHTSTTRPAALGLASFNKRLTMDENRTDDRRKNPDDRVTRREWTEAQAEAKTYRCDQKKKLDGIHTALFAKDDKNEHGQVGLMVTARNIDNHITVICNIVKWGLAAIGALLPIAIAAKQMGWL